MKRPSFQFYPGDWLQDASLRMVSVGARGLWIDMICLMHQGSEYGYLKVNHKVILPSDLARICGATPQKVNGWILELKDAGVFSITEQNCIYSRRMIRDEEIRKARAEGGVLGGNPALKGSSKVAKKVNLKANLQPTPSSSSSSSSTASKTKQDQKPSDAIAPAPKVPAVKIEPELQAACKITWVAYCKTYFDRYGTEPVRNVKVNSAVKLFVQRIGFVESPMVAAFYVNHNEKFYVQKAHPVELMLKDAEGLRTQWATGRTMTANKANQLDKTASNLDAVQQAKAMMAAKRERDGHNAA